MIFNCAQVNKWNNLSKKCWEKVDDFKYFNLLDLKSLPINEIKCLNSLKHLSHFYYTCQT
jgi:hypothetical protein